MSKQPGIVWNDQLLLAVSDVDETIAEVYTPADPAMITELSSLLRADGKLFMVTGGSLARVQRDITNRIDPALRHNILISHCSGAEVWGFTAAGQLRDQPFYSVYEETFSPEMKQQWRAVVDQLLDEFGLRPHPAQPKIAFFETIGRDPQDIMIDDRGPQITMEVVNGTNLSDEQLTRLKYKVPLTQGSYDLRTPIKERSTELFTAANIPITPRFGGNFALDFALESVSKTTSIKAVLANPAVLATIGLKNEDLQATTHLEVWGDKYSVLRGGTDRHMSEALPPEVRSIDFRQENPAEFPTGYNIVVWNGQRHLHDGLLEYLQSRNS